jgi:small subunit ribosomal protein S13
MLKSFITRKLKKYWYNPISVNTNFVLKEKTIYKQPNFFPVYKKKKQYFHLIMLDSIINNINTRQDMKAFLQRFYGYGLFRALKIALIFSFGKATYSFDTLHKRHRTVMIKLFEKKKYLLRDKLRVIRKSNITRLRQINCYRGIRHALYLPVRGQRTHTNAHMARYRASGTFEYVPKKPSSIKIKYLSKYSRRKKHILAASVTRYSRLLQKSYNEFKKNNRALFKQLEKKNKLGAFSRIHKEKLKLDKIKAKNKKKLAKK